MGGYRWFGSLLCFFGIILCVGTFSAGSGSRISRREWPQSLVLWRWYVFCWGNGLGSACRGLTPGGASADTRVQGGFVLFPIRILFLEVFYPWELDGSSFHGQRHEWHDWVGVYASVVCMFLALQGCVPPSSPAGCASIVTCTVFLGMVHSTASVLVVCSACQGISVGSTYWWLFGSASRFSRFLNVSVIPGLTCLYCHAGSMGSSILSPRIRSLLPLFSWLYYIFFDLLIHLNLVRSLSRTHPFPRLPSIFSSSILSPPPLFFAPHPFLSSWWYLIHSLYSSCLTHPSLSVGTSYFSLSFHPLMHLSFSRD